MSDRYPGGIITKTPVTPAGPYQDGAAPGIWTLEQQAYYKSQGLWPIAGNISPPVNSLRFRSSASAYLTRTPASAGNRQKWTFSAWVKLGTLSTNRIIFSAGTTSTYIRIFDDNTIGYGVSGVANYKSTAVFRDPSAWYHVVCTVDTTLASGKVVIYVNNTAYLTTDAGYSLNASTTINNNVVHTISRDTESPNSMYLDNYIAEVNFIDGQALTPSSFGQTNSTTGTWQPKAYSGTYGTNGFYLPLSTSTYTANYSLYTTSNSDYLQVPSSDTSFAFGTGAFTVEFWYYPTSSPSQWDALFNTQGNNGTFFQCRSGYLDWTNNYDQAALIRSTWPSNNQWHHIVMTQNASNSRSVFIDGTRTGNASNWNWGQAGPTIGGAKGYFSNVRVVKGTAVYDPNSASITVPTAPLTAISGTQLLTCQNSTFTDYSSNAYTLTTAGSASAVATSPFGGGTFTDSSGNGNNWTAYNISNTSGYTYDFMLDVPTPKSATIANYPTLNPLNPPPSTSSLNSANLTVSSSSNGTANFYSTMAFPSTGKWYFEYVNTSGPYIGGPGISSVTPASSYGTYSYFMNEGGNIYDNGTITQSTGVTFTANDIIGIRLDMDNHTIQWYKNNTAMNSTPYSINASQTYFAMLAVYNAVSSLNFGQRPFTYSLPSGYLALNTYNLPTPTILQGNQYFAPVLYTGTGSSNSVNVGFQPSFSWAKARSAAYINYLFDAVRGADKYVISNATDAEYTGDTAFTSTGFSMSSDINANGTTYASWNWKGNGAGSSNTDGSITSTVSASQTSGFSIVTYTGNGSAGATVGHGLGATPKLILVKCRTQNYHWAVYSSGLTSAAYSLWLDENSAQTNSYNYWNSTAPTSSVFSIGTDLGSNHSGQTFVAYCFAEIPGFSAIGTYTGNGSNTDGPFVYTGFKPAYTMIKAYNNTGEWTIHDNQRPTYNQSSQYLFADVADSEYNNIYNNIDYLSNGFKCRGTTGTNQNGNGYNYIYLAFAENPFKYALAR